MANQLRLDVAQLTDVGRKREHNEDNMAYVIPKDPLVMASKGALFIVADGMGGHAAGEVASEIAVDTVSNVYYQDDSDDVAVSLLHAIRRANASIHQRAAENMLRSGMGTTCVAAVLRGNMAYVANVGDSRAYLLRGSQVKQISQDHSWVAEQVRAGLLTEDQARSHAQRNVITRCLGTQAEVDVDVFHEELIEGDSLVLCTDGLSGLVSDEELQRIVEQFVPQESVYHLVERANENGGPDNITAIVVRVHEVGEEPPGVLHAVRVGGREMGDDTVILGKFAGAPLGIAASNGEGRIPSTPLRLSSGPLISSPDSVTAPQPVLGKSQWGRSRLFYPTLALIALLIITGIGGGVFYYLRSNEGQKVSQILSDTQTLLKQAQGEVASNHPASAFKTLATAQNMLGNVQKNLQLDETQKQWAAQLQAQLVTQVNAAIKAYNHGANIVVLPCSTTATHTIGNTSTGTPVSPKSIAFAEDINAAAALYLLAQDNVYLVTSQDTLLSKQASSPSLRILNISSNGARLFVLVEQLNGTVPTGYTLNVYQPDQAGNLGKPVSSVQISTNVNKEVYAPILTTAWGNQVYVVLSSLATNQNNARVLSYALDAAGHLGVAKGTDFSVSAPPIVSVTAFPNQLFLLLADGGVRSLPLVNGSQVAVLTGVLVQTPIALPLATSGKGYQYQAGDAVPAVTPVEQGNDAPLSVLLPSAASPSSLPLLSASQIGGIPHLYLGDSEKHRVLDLSAYEPPGGGPVTPTPTPSGTNSAGSSEILQLNQQYVLPADSSAVKSLSLVFDPKDVQLDVLSQNTLVTVPMAQQTTCS